MHPSCADPCAKTSDSVDYENHHIGLSPPRDAYPDSAQPQSPMTECGTGEPIFPSIWLLMEPVWAALEPASQPVISSVMVAAN